MGDHDNSIDNQPNRGDQHSHTTSPIAKIIEGDTYPISDNDSTTDVTSLICTNVIQDEYQGELNHGMSQDSLVIDDDDDDDDNNNDNSSNNNNNNNNNNNRSKNDSEKIRPNSSVTLTQSKVNSKLQSSTICTRSLNIDEHIKLVKQKKEEAEVLRLHKFQEHLRQKEQKWKQQHLEKIQKWLQLRNRDTDHRSQVEERRKRLEEENRVKIEEILRREKEREQRTNPQVKVNARSNGSYRPDSVMSMSTDILINRRAISAPRLRLNHHGMADRRASNESPVTITSQDNGDNQATTAVLSPRQLNPIDEHRSHHRSRRPDDAAVTNEHSSLSGTPRTLTSGRTRPMPTSYAYWLNTGDNNTNSVNASFMRSTYSAACRSRLSRSVERCPRACRAREELLDNNATTVTTNNEPQRRVQSVNRQQLNETIRRLSKPKTIPMIQSMHNGVAVSTVATTTQVTTSGIPTSQSSHQLRLSTPPPNAVNNSTSVLSSRTRKNVRSRPMTVLSNQSSPSTDSRASPTGESTADAHVTSSSIKQPSQRTSHHRKLPTPPSTLTSSSKPPISAQSFRSKSSTQRSVMSTSHSSSSISSSATTNKQNKRHIGATPPSSQLKSKTEAILPVETLESSLLTKNNEEEKLPVDEKTFEITTEPDILPVVNVQAESTDESPNIDLISDMTNSSIIPKREQQTQDEQEYQRKLTQKIREAQQRLELERQREEERKRQLEQEEYEREQEEIRLEEAQRAAEKERLQRAIEERERENELKRQEEQRLQQQREELERKQAEESERLNRERQERIKREDDERNERKRRLNLIMQRTRQTSPSLKPDNNSSRTNIIETNGHEQQQSIMSHSISDNRFPVLLANENNDNNNNEPVLSETAKFKSPLIQSLLNKARNTKSADSMITSQTANENIVDEERPTIQSTPVSDLSYDDNDHQLSDMNNTINGHSDSSTSSSINLTQDHSIETTAMFE